MKLKASKSIKRPANVATGLAVCKRLYRLSGPSQSALLLLSALSLLLSLIAVLLPWPLQMLVDHLQGKPTLISQSLAGLSSGSAAILLLVGAGFALHLLNGLLEVVRTKAIIAASQRSVFDLRVRLFEHYQKLALTHHTSSKMGDRLYRLNNDTYCIDQLVFSGLIPLAGSAVTLVAMFVVLCRLDLWLALLSLCVVPFITVCVTYYLSSLETHSDRVRQSEADVMSLAEQVLRALPLVKAFVREQDESERFRHTGALALNARLQLTGREAWFNLACGVVTAGGTALVLWVGALHVAAGTLTIGQLLVVLAYLSAVYGPLHSVSYSLGQLRQSVSGGRRILEVLSLEGEKEESEIAAEGHAGDALLSQVRGDIEFDQVSFGYNAAAPVLSEVSLKIPAQSVVALVGPTGAGKSTLISMLLRFADPQSGSIMLDGTDLRRISPRALRSQISVVLQDSLLFPVSVADNLRYGNPQATMADVRRAAQIACAEQFILELPDGYDTVLTEHGASLSGGERQRLALARAVLKNAPILILDEPTSALDAETEALLLQALEQVMKGRTTILIAHRLSTIRRADMIVVIDRGRVREYGRHEELLAKKGMYARFHDIQFGGRIPDINEGVNTLRATAEPAALMPN